MPPFFTMATLRGSCNRCGQCCGLDSGDPGIGWGLWESCRQYEESPDADLNALRPAQVELYRLTKRAIDKPKRVLIKGRQFQILVKSGVGLVKSEAETYCPFLDYGGEPDGSHPCLVHGASWQKELCQKSPRFTRFINQSLPEVEVEGAKRFFENHPKCGFYPEEAT